MSSVPRAAVRRAALVAVALAVLFTGLARVDRPAVAARATTAQVQQSRPNIVTVMADDMRTDDLRYMPHVRRLVVHRGLLFRNSFSPYPLCCPARASFLTGRYAHNHGVFSHEKPWGFQSFDDHATIAGALQRAGYRTAFVGKYLNGYGAERSLVTGGPSFHYVPNGWTDWYGAVERPPHSGYPSGGTYNYWHTLFNVNGRIDDTHNGDYQTTVLGRFARGLVTKYHRSDRPFFMWLSAVAPHFGRREKGDPRPVRRADGRVFKFDTPGRPAWVRGRFDDRITRPPGLPLHSNVSEADMSDKPRRMRYPEMNAVERARLTEVTRQRAEALSVLDLEVARLVRTLRHTGEWSNTVLMFTSDNGYFLGEHRQRTGKIKAHEPSLRVPFAITGPGVPVGGQRFDPITTEDVTATIADLAGATPYLPYPPDGSSRVPTIRHGDQGWSVPIVTEGLVGGRWHRTPDQLARGFHDARNTIGIRTARYKYIRDATGFTELYDLDKDPNELHGVAHDPAYAHVRRELADLWTRLKDCAGPECRVPAPADLQRDPAALHLLTDQQSRGVQKRYGYWR